MSSRKVAFGKIVGAHGVKGELKVLPYIEKDEMDGLLSNLQGLLNEFYIDGIPYEVKGIKRHKGVFLVKLRQIRRRDEAEALVGKEVFVERRALPALPEGEYYAFELIGLSVVTEDGSPVGRLIHIFSTGSNDVYEVETPEGKELLLPAIEDVILSIEPENGRVVVRLPEGLRPEGSGK